MLPDYPGLKDHLFERLREFLMQRREFHLGRVGQVPRSVLGEGHAQVFIHASRQATPIEFKEVGSTIELGYADLPSMTMEDILRLLDAAAEEIAKKMAQDLYRTISRASEALGNVVDAGGARLSAEHLIETFSKLEVDFDSHGRPTTEIHIHPSLKDALNRVGEELETNPQLKREFMAVITRKREEWRAREAARKLVG